MTPRPGRALRIGRRTGKAPWTPGDAGWLVGIACGLSVLLAAVSLQPLLRGGWWLPMTVLVVALITVVGAGARGLRAPAPVQPLAQAAALVVALLAGFTRGDLEIGRFEQLRLLAAQGRHYAEVTQAPAGPDPGLLLLLVGGLGLAAVAVDTLAADIDLPGLSLLALVAIFAVPWAIDDLHAPWWAFCVVAIAWLVILAATQHHRLRGWSEQAGPGSVGVGLLAAAATLCAAVIGGTAAAAREPFSGLDLSWGQGGGNLQVDTLVSLRRSLVGTDDRVVLRYTTTEDAPDYFRTAVLDRFDGTQWSESRAGYLAETPPSGVDAGAQELADQPEQYAMDIGALAGTVVPSPWGTISSANTWPVLWDQRTAILRRSDGAAVTSSRAILVTLPRDADASTMRLSSLELSPFGPESPGSDVLLPIQGPHQQLVNDLAREITAGATSPYDRAVALQRWFTLSGGFSYSTEVESGSGDDALASFLTDRVGYCEQYAAAMAVMARALDIPARVAVGFTQGTQQDDGDWVVRASDAHAWPELWMGSAGWVRFEPTPGAPTTRTPLYTSDQAPGGAAPVLPSAASPGASAADPDRSTTLDDDQQLGGEATGTRQAPGWLWVLLVLALLGAVPGLARVQRRTRRLRRDDPEWAYAEVLDTAADLGLADPGPTPRAALATIRTALVSAGLVEAPPAPDRPGWVDGPAAIDPAAHRLGMMLDGLRDSVEQVRYGAAAEGDEPRAARPGPIAGERSGGEGSFGQGSSGDSRRGALGGLGHAGSGTPAGVGGTGGTALAAPWRPRDAAGELPGAAGQAREISSALRSTVGRAGRLRAMVLPRSVLSGWAARVLGGADGGPADPGSASG